MELKQFTYVRQVAECWKLYKSRCGAFHQSAGAQQLCQ